jgi:ankyrin repeat protein
MKKALLVSCCILALAAWLRPQEIFDAFRKDDIQTVKALVEKNPDTVNACDPNGDTPLHYAAYGGGAALINFLIDKSAKVEAQNTRHQTALHVAAINDRTEAVAALLRRGASIETRDDYGRSPLVLCARERGGVETARILIASGADVNSVDKFGSSALELAAWRGKREFVDLLLARGARVPEPGPQWYGLVFQSASRGLTTLFRRLTDKTQNLKDVDGAAESLLHAAAAGGSAEIVGDLLDKGFDPARADRYGWTPLHYAARDGRTEAACLLLERGAPIDVRTIMGQTAFNIAQERAMKEVATLLATNKADLSGIRFPVLEGDYLGQKPPQSGSELFARGIVASIWGLHSTAVFYPDGNEVYWAPMLSYPGEIYSHGGLLMMKRVKGRWTAPSWAPFSGPDLEDDVPFFSPDGQRLYFISNRPFPGEKEARKESIWFVDKRSDGWSSPRPLDAVVNDHDMHWEFSLDGRGNLYFGGQGPDSLGMGDIYLARFVDGKYEKPVNLGKPVNSEGAETTPFIAPDGSYLLFSRQFDLWVSFRGDGGAWSEPIKLGPEVNSPSVELCPMITSDGKYLFFLSQRDGESHPHWVRADVVEKLRPEGRKR